MTAKMEGLRKEEDSDKPSVNQVEKELSLMGKRTARNRKEWWKPRSTRCVVLGRKMKK
jgi:hypothetical protein